MGEINLDDSDKRALREIDDETLRDLIYKAATEGHLGELYRLPLSACGPHVSSKLHQFNEALQRYREAKSAKNREDKRSDAIRAGHDLSSAVTSMKRRMENEEREAMRFRIDDNILWPRRFDKHLNVRVHYRWRTSVEDEWRSVS